MTEMFQERLEKGKSAINQADFILLGGGAGLSAAAGIKYSGPRFTENFGPFIKKYGLTDMYSAGFYPFKTEEERWAYWSKHISINRYEPDATPLYKDLFKLVRDRDYFVITTNVESQFMKAGFSPDKLFEVQGNYGELQCTKGCHQKSYPNESIIKEMVNKTVDCKIQSDLVPKCPVCGGKMDPHLRINQYFVQDENWYEMNQAYNEFLQKTKGKKIIYMELGIGFNTPGIVRYPFERMTYENDHATLIRLNKDNPDGIEENKDKTIAFTEDMQEVVTKFMR